MALVAGAYTRITNDFNIFEVLFPITATGNYVTNGVTLDLTPVGAPSNSLPDEVEIFEVPPTGTASSGLEYIYAKGTTLANGAVQCFNGTTQIGNGVSFSSLNAANIQCLARFLKFQ